MIILGVDPGLKATGYGLIKIPDGSMQNYTFIQAGTVKPNVKDLIHQRLLNIYDVLNAVIEEHRPDVLVLEKLYAHAKHPTTASILGHVRGVICLLCGKNGLQLAEHSVKRIRKSITGNGGASKEQTQRVVKKLLCIRNDNLSLDASDALALALGYAHLNQIST